MNRKLKMTLVAGGAGFIGSHLCERLVKEGHNVLCVDNLYTGCMDNIRHLLRHPKFTFKEHDIINPLTANNFPLSLIWPALHLLSITRKMQSLPPRPPLWEH